MKICTKCKKQKPISEFHKDKSRKDGFRYVCKKCLGNYYQKWQQIHKVKITKYNKDYYQTIVGHLRKCFSNIKRRCNNSGCPDYKNYGGRGIKCLFKSSQEFVDYIINVLKINPHNLEIDRIDNNGHYEKGNIRFVTRKINRNNRNR